MVRPGTGTSVPVPCGRCAPCKKRRVSQWVFRLTQEEKISTSSHFVTLTYDTESVPISPNGFMTLHKPDLQNFFKRLRKLSPDAKIKYYAVGEYGSTNKRPHYHMIIFNVPNTQNFVDAWTLNGKLIGNVDIRQVNTNRMAYTMKYIDKPPMPRLFKRQDQVKEFPLMSKGIGSNYLSSASRKYHKQNLDKNYVTGLDNHKIAMPKYYRDKILTDDERELQRNIIQTQVEKLNMEEYINYQHYPKVPGWDFAQYKEHQRHARHTKFYHNQPKRDV